MRVLRQFGIIAGLWLAGEALNRTFHLIIPGGIIGMLILLLLLETKIIKETDLKEVTDFLLGNLAFFFVPAGVALITVWDVVQDTWWKIGILVLAVSVIVTGVTGITVQMMTAKKVKK